MRHLILALLLVTLPASAMAQAAPPKLQLRKPEIVAVPAGEDKIEALSLEEPAPFAGQLYSPATALRWANYLEQYQLQLRLTYEGGTKLLHLQRAYFTSLREIEAGSCARVQEDLRQRLVRVEDHREELAREVLEGPAWYDGRTFGVVLGVAGTLATVLVYSQLAGGR